MSENNSKIPFNKPFTNDVIEHKTFEIMTRNPLGDLDQDRRLEAQLRMSIGLSDRTDVFFTQSATQALEMMALTLDLKVGDEIIIPSYTYAATANAFARTGATLVFADVSMETLNITIDTIEPLITEKTKAIIPIHYGGFAADLHGLLNLSDTYCITLLEDAAHGIGSQYEKKPLGTMGQMGCLSFHQSKNITAGGSGGVLFINNETIERDKVEAIYYQGTDRVDFLKGKTSAYNWQRLGGEYAMTPYAMAYLEASLCDLEMVTRRRTMLWARYQEAFNVRLFHFLKGQTKHPIGLPTKIANANGNGHIYYLIMPDAISREGLRLYLKDRKIDAYTHYEPLHLSEGGKKYGKTMTELTHTEAIANRMIRLPIFDALSEAEQDRVIDAVVAYVKHYGKR